MAIKEFIELCKAVLSHWEVIATVIAIIFVLKFTTFVIKYRKKPRRSKKKKSSTPPPKPKPAPAPKPEAEEDGAAIE